MMGSSEQKKSEGTAQRVIITGGATNIGKAISEHFLDSGCRVAIGQPDIGVVDPLVAAYPEQVIPLELHLEDPESCAQLIADAETRLGGVDVLVNNAALSGPGSSRPFLDLDTAFIDEILAVNLKGTIHCSLHAARAMKASGKGGVIIHITSINAYRPQNAASIYAAAKAALTSLTQSMAKELAAHQIRVLAVAPGDIWTDGYEQMKQAQETSGMHNEIIGQTPLGQGQPGDIAAVVHFLASPDAKFLTGTAVIADGGLLA